jgi:hypothetical protein
LPNLEARNPFDVWRAQRYPTAIAFRQQIDRKGVMSNMQPAQPDTGRPGSPPKAVGFVRGDIAVLEAPRHAVAVQRHARALGYQYLYTIRPPHDTADPIGYAIGIAAGLDVAAIVVYDLAHVDNNPGRICEDFDLETVCPPETWARVAQPAADLGVA